MPVWMSWTLSVVPGVVAGVSPAVERTAALSTREFPVTSMDSGVAQTPGVACWAYKGTEMMATSASIAEKHFRITQIYTNQFGGGPRPRASILIRQRGSGGV